MKNLANHRDGIHRLAIVVIHGQAIRTPRPAHSYGLVRQRFIPASAARDTDGFVAVAALAGVDGVRGVEGFLGGHHLTRWFGYVARAAGWALNRLSRLADAHVTSLRRDRAYGERGGGRQYWSEHHSGKRNKDGDECGWEG
jgi:hypothetical protein